MKTEKPPMIYIDQACLKYGDQILFENISLTLNSAKTTCLLGPSGVGKSTLLRSIAGLFSPDSVFQGRIICNPTISLQDHISYIAQNDDLLPWLNAFDNVLLGARLRGNKIAHLHDTVTLLFSQMGLINARHKFPHQLSGGMRQRITLIRTVIENKPIVLMDEPFSSLDAITRIELQNMTSMLLKDRTVFLVTHDPLEALRLADTIYILSGKPANISLFAEFTSATPREFNHPDILQNQCHLFAALTKAKDMTVCI